jgi:hypothetical protein
LPTARVWAGVSISRTTSMNRSAAYFVTAVI